jgi:hypothetical protein
MNGTLSGIYSAAVFLALFAFGWCFNRRIERLGADADGFVWLLVVIGCSVTLIGTGLLDLVLDWNAGLLGFAAFAASGFFMCYGAVVRYIALRRRLKDIARNDAPKTLAE